MRLTTRYVALIAIALAVGFCAGLVSRDPLSARIRSVKYFIGEEPFLAGDAKTGDYLGVVVNECRDWNSRKVTGYKISLANGEVVEKPEGSVKIYAP